MAKFPSLPDAVPATLVADLGEAGRAFVETSWREFSDWSTPSLLLLRRAGQLVDLEQQARAAGDLKQWQSVHRLLLLTLAGINLRGA